MTTQVAETPVFMYVVFLIRLDTTSSNVRFLHVLWGWVSEPRLKNPYTTQAEIAGDLDDFTPLCSPENTHAPRPSFNSCKHLYSPRLSSYYVVVPILFYPP